MSNWLQFRTSRRGNSAHRPATKQSYKPLLITAAVLGVALAAGGAYHFVRQQRPPRYKSRSRKPQISRFESEGGDVPQVEALRPNTTRH